MNASTHTIDCVHVSQSCSFGTQRFQLKASNASSDQNQHSPDQLNGAYCYSDLYNPAELGHYVGDNLG